MGEGILFLPKGRAEAVRIKILPQREVLQCAELGIHPDAKISEDKSARVGKLWVRNLTLIESAFELDDLSLCEA